MLKIGFAFLSSLATANSPSAAIEQQSGRVLSQTLLIVGWPLVNKEKQT